MGARRKTSTRTTKEAATPTPTAEIAAGLIAAVERDGAVLKAEVTKRAARNQLLAVFDALVHAGLEVSTRFVRRPIETQLLERLGGGPLRLRGLDKVLRGTTTREITEAATSLVERRRARLAVRGRELLLAPADAPMLDARARQRLRAVVMELAASLALAEKKGGSLLREHVEEALKPFLGAPPPPNASAPHDVASLVEAHRESSGLTFVPKLVRLLGGTSARDALHARSASAGICSAESWRGSIWFPVSMT